MVLEVEIIKRTALREEADPEAIEERLVWRCKVCEKAKNIEKAESK